MGLSLGPLKSLFESDDITEIMVNSWNKIYVEHKGLLVETVAKFVDQREFEELIYVILAESGKNLNQGYCFDGVLKESGYRYNITMPPMSPKGPALTVRKFSIKNFTLAELVHSKFMTAQVSTFLKAAVEARLSVVICGGTGSGKTSFLNTLGTLISHDDRVVSIEDVAELRLQHPNWIALQAVNEDSKKVSVRDCLVNSLRMRPNRIIVGECRKDETFEMLQAMNTGHNGSMTTVHGNSPTDCLTRLESLVQFSGVDLPMKQIRGQLARAIDLIVQIRRLPNGVREISEIIEITGMENDVISRSVLFERDKAGSLICTGYVPRVLNKINANKIVLPSNFFVQSSDKRSA